MSENIVKLPVKKLTFDESVQTEIVHENRQIAIIPTPVVQHATKQSILNQKEQTTPTHQSTTTQYQRQDKDASVQCSDTKDDANKREISIDIVSNDNSIYNLDLLLKPPQTPCIKEDVLSQALEPLIDSILVKLVNSVKDELLKTTTTREPEILQLALNPRPDSDSTYVSSRSKRKVQIVVPDDHPHSIQDNKPVNEISLEENVIDITSIQLHDRDQVSALVQEPVIVETNRDEQSLDEKYVNSSNQASLKSDIIQTMNSTTRVTESDQNTTDFSSASSKVKSETSAISKSSHSSLGMSTLSTHNSEGEVLTDILRFFLDFESNLHLSEGEVGQKLDSDAIISLIQKYYPLEGQLTSDQAASNPGPSRKSKAILRALENGENKDSIIASILSQSSNSWDSPENSENYSMGQVASSELARELSSGEVDFMATEVARRKANLLPSADDISNELVAIPSIASHKEDGQVALKSIQAENHTFGSLSSISAAISSEGEESYFEASSTKGN